METQSNVTPRFDLMSDKEYCRYMIAQVENEVTRGSGYIAKVQALATDAGHKVNEQQIIQTRNGRLFNRTLAYLINMAGLQIRQENASKASDSVKRLYAVSLESETK